jgi:hypothetical protein
MRGGEWTYGLRTLLWVVRSLDSGGDVVFENKA